MKIFSKALVASVITLMPASASLADPGLTDVRDHQHYLQTPNDPVRIGPDVCSHPNLQGAFDQFHNNVHHATTAGTLGPQHGAPGLHDGEGVELEGGACG